MANLSTALILSCKGGGAHLAAERALTPLLAGRFQVTVIYPLEYTGVEPVYNALLERGYTGTASAIATLVSPVFDLFTRCYFTKRLEREIQRVDPRIVISIAPLFNRAALCAAERLGLPYLLVTVDCHLGNYFPGGRRIEAGNYEKLRVITQGNLQTTDGLLSQLGVEKEQIVDGGLPLRPQFMEQMDARETLCQRLVLPQDKKIVLIMMGGAGSPRSFFYANLLLETKPDLHVVVICGRDQATLQKLNALNRPSLTALGFVNNVWEYMKVADLLVTKPGPGTLTEARVIGTPVLLDGVPTPLYWEAPILDLPREWGMGDSARSQEEILPKLDHLLASPRETRVAHPSRFNEAFGRCLNELTIHSEV